jgi:hypothetical protein
MAPIGVETLVGVVGGARFGRVAARAADRTAVDRSETYMPLGGSEPA